MYLYSIRAPEMIYRIVISTARVQRFASRNEHVSRSYVNEFSDFTQKKKTKLSATSRRKFSSPIPKESERVEQHDRIRLTQREALSVGGRFNDWPGTVRTLACNAISSETMGGELSFVIPVALNRKQLVCASDSVIIPPSSQTRLDRGREIAVPTIKYFTSVSHRNELVSRKKS